MTTAKTIAISFPCNEIKRLNERKKATGYYRLLIITLVESMISLQWAAGPS
jgi:hypothetical protein